MSREQSTRDDLGGRRPADSPLRRWGPLCLILLLGFALRVYLVGAQNVWWDEALAIWARRKGFIPMTLWTASDVHPPLFFWSLFGITSLAGQTEFAARFPSVIYGLLTIPLAYQLGRKLLGERIGTLAALLVAVARFHVWWSQEMRMYMLAGFLGLASLYSMVDWWQRERAVKVRAWRALIPHVLASAAALYTLYLAVFVLLVESVFVFLAALNRKPRERWRLWRRWALAQVMTVLLFLPWLALALPRMHTWSSSTPFDFSVFVKLYLTSLSLGVSANVERYLWLALPFMAICLAGLAQAWRDRRLGDRGASGFQAGLLLAICLSVPPLAVYALSRPRGLFYSPHVEARYLLPFAPPFYILLAWSLETIRRRARLAGAAALVLVLAVFAWSLPQHYRGRYLRDELQSMMQTISAYGDPEDAVCVVSGNRYPVFDYYYDDSASGGERPTVRYLPAGEARFTAKNVAAQFEPILESHPRIWLAMVDANLQDPDGLAQPWVDGRLSQLYHERFGHNSLALYASDNDGLSLGPTYAPQFVVDWLLPRGGSLWGYDLATTQYGPGDSAHLSLVWKSTGRISVRVELQDLRARSLAVREVLVASQGSGATRQSFAFPIHERTPGGVYRFRVALLGQDGVELASHDLGQIEVVYAEPQPRVGSVESPLSLNVGQVARLEGYRARVIGRRGEAAAISGGDTLELTLYWRGTAKVGERYTVFTHLLGQAFNPATNGPVWAQHDSEPMDGGWPTTAWFVGDLIADVHRLEVPATAPPGDYQLEIGLYQVATGHRLPIWDDAGTLIGDRVLLDGFSLQQGR